MSYGSSPYGSTPYGSQGGGLQELHGDGLVFGTVLSRPSLGQFSLLSGEGLALPTILSRPSLGQVLVGDGLVFGTVLSRPASALLGNLVFGTKLSTPALAQQQEFFVDNLVFGTVLSRPRAGSSLIFISRNSGDWYNPELSAEHDDVMKLASGVWVSRDGEWYQVYFGT